MYVQVRQMGNVNRLGASPPKSLQKLAQQTGISYSSCRKAVKTFQLFPYKIIVIQLLLPPDCEKQCHYHEWLLAKVEDDPPMSDIFFSDEACFHLTDHVNSQNTHIWSMENPHAAHETPLHPIKIGVWCAVFRCRIAGPIFFKNTINSGRCIDIVHEFLTHFTEEETAEAWFQQDSTTCHTAQAIMLELPVVRNQIILKKLWPPTSVRFVTIRIVSMGLH
jgi:hypothetical protein